MRWRWVGLFELFWNVNMFEIWLSSLWSHTSVILRKADLHIFVTTGFENRTPGCEYYFLAHCISFSSLWWLMSFMVGFYTLWWSYQIIHINLSPVVLCGVLCHLSWLEWSSVKKWREKWNGAARKKVHLIMSFALSCPSAVPVFFFLWVHSEILKPTQITFILNVRTYKVMFCCKALQE